MMIKADVIVPAIEDADSVIRCVRRVLEDSGPALDRVILVDGFEADGDSALARRDWSHFGASILVLRVPPHFGFAASCNRGLNESRNDAVLFGCEGVVGPGWLDELTQVARDGERTACSAPVSVIDETTSACDLNRREQFGEIARASIQGACAKLPRFTTVPSVRGSCVYLRRDKIDAVGLLDARLDSASAAIDDWVCRAQELGFVARRANHVYIYRLARPNRAVSEGLDEGGHHAIFPERDRQFRRQVERFCTSLDGRLAEHAIRVEGAGKLRVALDLRALPREQVGTRTYAVGLGRALALLPEVELTLLVRDPAQAGGLSGRVVTAEEWRDDVEVIHRPAQVLDPRDLALLFRSSAHVVLTYQDLIGYRTPLAAPSDAWFDRYRATSNLSVRAVQRIIVYSQNTGGEIAAEFGIPRDEIAVVPLGVDANEFAHRDIADREVRHRLKLPDRYLFSLATDFPHKNLTNLLEAYALFCERWPDSEAPELVLAGHTSSARAGIYGDLAPHLRSKKGSIRFLGAVSSHQLRVLYQHALAFVFPSLYEGFGLPPLEAMAAGTPVIAMRISAVPEVVGDCAHYPKNLSAASLASALEQIACDPELRSNLSSRGLTHIAKFRWENTAKATLEVYRSAVLDPSERSLRGRRHLRDAILRWADPTWAGDAARIDPIGIREAWKALTVAVAVRLRRELKRFQPRLPGGAQNRPASEAGRPTGAAVPRPHSAKGAGHRARRIHP